MPIKLTRCLRVGERAAQHQRTTKRGTIRWAVPIIVLAHWVRSKTYKPNGRRECARRVRQMRGAQ